MRPAWILVLVLTLAPAPITQSPGPDRLRADVEFLSSSTLEGRASLSRGAERTVAFLADQMRKIGLQPIATEGYLQPFELLPLQLDHEKTTIRLLARGDPPERQSIPGSVFFPNPARPIDLTLEVVFAGFGITAPELNYDDYSGIDVRGRAVLVFDHEPQEDQPGSIFNGTGFTLHANAWTKTRNAQEHGAAAVLLVTEPVHSHRSVPRATDRANAPPQALVSSELTIPRVTVPAPLAEALLEGSGRTAAEWQAEIERRPSPASRLLRGVRVELAAANMPAPASKSWNVAGLLPGSDPALRDETILVTSHHDHLGVQNGKLYPGANDNASGVAAMLEAARQLAKDPPARSVLFVAFGSEEQLMLGSYHYVAHPLRPLETTRAVLNLDMIGRNEEHTPESVGAYGLSAARSDELNLVGTVYSPDLEAILAKESTGTGLALSTKFDRDSSMRALFRCDHLPFLQKGIPAVWLFGGFHPGYHEPADTPDRLDFEKIARTVRLTVAATRALGTTRIVPRFGAR